MWNVRFPSVLLELYAHLGHVGRISNMYSMTIVMAEWE